MAIKRVAASVAVAAGLAGSGIVFSAAWSDTSTPSPVTTTSSPVATTATMSLDELVLHAADKAVIMRLCENGRNDPDAEASYLAASKAHPELAADIGPDCRVPTGAP